MYNNNHELGKYGENLAKKYLLNKGYKVLAENYRSFAGEIDLIVSKKDYIIFIEVKTRTSSNFGLPQEAVDSKKINRIRKIAIHFLNNDCFLSNLKYKKRFDVIAIFITSKKAKLKHFKNVF